METMQQMNLFHVERIVSAALEAADKISVWEEEDDPDADRFSPNNAVRVVDLDDVEVRRILDEHGVKLPTWYIPGR